MVTFLRRAWSLMCSFPRWLSHSVGIPALQAPRSRLRNLTARLSLALMISVSFSPSVYAAVATPSDAGKKSDSVKEEDAKEEVSLPDLDKLLDDDDLNEMEKYDLFEMYLSSFTGPGVASGSNATLENIESMVSDIRSHLLPDAGPDSNDGADLPESILALSDADLETFAADGENHYVNCVRYDCVVSGTACTLLFPTSARSSLFIDKDGYLWNMTTSTVQGRVIYDDAFDPMADEGTLVYLTPCLGNNFSSNHSGYSPNYFRSYYWSTSDRLTYTDAYVRILVEESPFIFYTEDIPVYVLILIGGACLLCLLKKSLR